MPLERTGSSLEAHEFSGVFLESLNKWNNIRLKHKQSRGLTRVHGTSRLFPRVSGVFLKSSNKWNNVGLKQEQYRAYQSPGNIQTLLRSFRSFPEFSWNLQISGIMRDWSRNNMGLTRVPGTSRLFSGVSGVFLKSSNKWNNAGLKQEQYGAYHSPWNIQTLLRSFRSFPEFSWNLQISEIIWDWGRNNRGLTSIQTNSRDSRTVRSFSGFPECFRNLIVIQVHTCSLWHRTRHEDKSEPPESTNIQVHTCSLWHTTRHKDKSPRINYHPSAHMFALTHNTAQGQIWTPRIN